MDGTAFDMEKFRLMMAQVNRVKEYLEIVPHIPDGVICMESDQCDLDKLFKCAHDHRILSVVEQMMYNWRRESEVKLRRPRGSFYL